jgi:hypothetical protein
LLSIGGADGVGRGAIDDGRSRVGRVLHLLAPMFVNVARVRNG